MNGSSKRKKSFENDSFHFNKVKKTSLDYPFNFEKEGISERSSEKEQEKKEDCSLSETCFFCKIDGENLTKCSVKSCSKYYHDKCLLKLPSFKGDASACPLHFCTVCYSKNPKVIQRSSEDLVKCFKCPTAFHIREECHVAGAVLLSKDTMSCPEHFFPAEHRGYDALHNLNFCVACGGNENLIYCKFCPESVHIKCSKYQCIDGKYVCDKCELKNITLYGDIIWAKVYNFRWWPAKVLNLSNPEVKNITHFEGEFPIQFFGTDEFYWVQKQRVYPFVYKSVDRDGGLVSHNFKKCKPDLIFQQAVELALDAVAAKQKILISEGLNRKKLPPYKHIKSNRPVGNVQIYTSHNYSDHSQCGCKPDDINPCGYDSLCLNRSMLTECEPGFCKAGDLCQNRKIQNTENASVAPYLTEGRGWGLKCLTDIKKGHFIIEYCGDLIDEEECERRIEHKQETGDTNFYFCTLDSNRIIDAGPKGNYSRFMNHSCEPNCETQKWMVHGDYRVGIFAMKDISAGMELTFDYQMDFSYYEKLKCKCGSKQCSGLIGKKPLNGHLNNGCSDHPDATENYSSSEKKLTHFIEDTISTNSSSSDVQKNDSRKSSIKTKLPKKRKLDCRTIANGLSSEIKKKNSNKTRLAKKENIVCFKCKIGGKLLKCTDESCSKSFHDRCAIGNVCPKDDANWICPSHFCKKCKQKSLFQCLECPDSYCDVHVKNNFQIKTSVCEKH